MYLPWKSSRRRIEEAEQARRNRLEILKAWSQGQITRRDMLRYGLITAGGALAAVNGLSPFARSAYADVPTGTGRSPIPRGIEFTQPLPRPQEFVKKAITDLSPAPMIESNQTFNAAKGVGPVEGRPPGPLWAHQRWDEFTPRLAIEAVQRPILPGHRFHPQLPEIRPEKVWTFDGTFPIKLLKARYGEPLLFRHYNGLPRSASQNGGFGRNTISTHLHNGHTPAESDGFAGAFFFSGQFYDYRWPMVLAGHDTINTAATDRRAGAPDDHGGIVNVPGDWRETQSSLWFHDHMIDFTSQNVYKGNVALCNYYSSLDRGNEEINDGVNLRLPSGSAASWGNTDYDVNLVVSDKALDSNGQLFFDIFDHEGFLGDVMTVNGAYKPYLEVERRKYRFRILNAGVARLIRLQLSDNSTFQWIGNDGNLMTQPLTVNTLDAQGVAERYDIVVDFSRYASGTKVHLVNRMEHDDGRRPDGSLSLSEALAGSQDDPGVGRILEFRVGGNPAKPDVSQVPAQLIPLPERKPIVRERTMSFGRSGGDDAPWTINVDGSSGMAANIQQIRAAPKPGTAEIWHLRNGGGGWEHPIHIHFEEGQTLRRSDTQVPAWERNARKDVWRLGPGDVDVYLQFREFAGTYVEHCHNTTHEDHAMLLRWDINGGPSPLPTPIPREDGVTLIPSDNLAR